MDQLAQVQRALEAIEAGLQRPLSIAALARRAGFSHWHFQRVFAAVVGEPVGQFIRRRRLTVAAQQLRAAPRRRLLDIALDFQFESHAAFTRAFHAQFLGHPSEFRRRRHIVWARARRPIAPGELHPLPYANSMSPAIVELPALTLVGCEASFISALSPDANNHAVIPPLWHAVMARRAEIAGPPDACGYGACRCQPAATRRRDDELLYLAAYAVAPDTPVPTGMTRWELPAQTYALFTHRGPISRLPETINFAFGAWLPRADYELVDGAELERYDARFRGEDPASELDYLLPVRPKRR